MYIYFTFKCYFSIAYQLMVGIEGLMLGTV